MVGIEHRRYQFSDGPQCDDFESWLHDVLASPTIQKVFEEGMPLGNTSYVESVASAVCRQRGTFYKNVEMDQRLRDEFGIDKNYHAPLLEEVMEEVPQLLVEERIRRQHAERRRHWLEAIQAVLANTAVVGDCLILVGYRHVEAILLPLSAIFTRVELLCLPAALGPADWLPSILTEK